MISIGRIVSNVVTDVTGSEQLGSLFGAGIDQHLGGLSETVGQFFTADLGGGSLFSKLMSNLGYNFEAGGYGFQPGGSGFDIGAFCAPTGQYPGAQSLLDENRRLDDMFAQAERTGDWSEVVDYEMSLSEYEEIDSDDAAIDDMYAEAKRTGDWSEVTSYETSLPEYEEIDSDDAAIDEMLQDGLDLLDETSDLNDIAEYEAEEQSISDDQRGELRA